MASRSALALFARTAIPRRFSTASSTVLSSNKVIPYNYTTINSASPLTFDLQATARGGRGGVVRSDDGVLNLEMKLPKSLGGTGEVTNMSCSWMSCSKLYAGRPESREPLRLRIRILLQWSLLVGMFPFRR